MADTISGRRVRGAKLGMTVQPKKKTPFDAIGERMLAGEAEEERLEMQGRRRVGKEAAKTQRRIPKAGRGGRKGGVRA